MMSIAEVGTDLMVHLITCLKKAHFDHVAAQVAQVQHAVLPYVRRVGAAIENEI